MWLSTWLCLVSLTAGCLAADPRLLPRGQWQKAELNIINATPYLFKRVRSSSYQVSGWNDEKTRAEIQPGEMMSFTYEFQRGTFGEDSAADIVYRLVIDGKDTEKQFLVHMQGNDGDGFALSADLFGGLSAAGHGSGNGRFQFVSYNKADSGRSNTFILAGDEKSGYSTVAPPADWINAMGADFKKSALKDIVLPASHDSGASSVTGNLGGIPYNTQTQDVDIYEQLRRGIRYFDARPYIDCRGGQGCDGKEWQLGHFSDGGVGGFGQSVLSMIENINRFNREYPGELIILDMTDGGPFRHIGNSIPITPKEIHAFIDQVQYTLAGMTHKYERKTADQEYYLGAEPLSTFFTDQHRSPILIRLPADFPDDRIAKKGATTFTGFVAADMLPVFLPSYSDTSDANKMRDDQHDKLVKWSKNGKSWEGKKTLWLSAITLTTVTDIEKTSWSAKDTLYRYFWDWVKEAGTAPNFIQVDYVKDSQVAALAMALNKWGPSGVREAIKKWLATLTPFVGHMSNVP